MTNILSLFDTSLDKVVDRLRERYDNFLGPKIYTNFGSILVAVNPIYLTSDEYSSIYGQSALTNADAHIYAVAKRTLEMVRPGSQETVVVIGDSGSGKTVTVGHVLDYLTANSRSSKCELFYQKILSASHLMELFANAQTSLNTNSSRFGKLISLVYSCENVPQLEGAEIEAFLLEKSRVTSSPDPTGCGENFHILRLLVSKMEDPILFERVFGFRRQKLLTGDFSFRVAPYCPDLADKCFSFDRARRLLSTFGCEEDVQLEIFKTLSVILHLCNLEFISRDEALGCEIAYHLPNVHTSVLSLQTLLNISDCREIQQALTTKPVTALSQRRQSVYRKPCGVAEAEGRRNSLARLLYSQLFEFVMQKICSSVAPNASKACKTANISVLDIFGFENFTRSHNDFEQLCINFCNERIQQHFARTCIGDVRRELASEGLSLREIESSYNDNEAILSLFEASPTGIFCVLDEKCRLNRTGGIGSPCSKLPTIGSGTKLTKASSFSHTSSPSSQSSEDFFQTMCHNFRGGSNKSIKLSMAGSCQFTIAHYAGPVVYSCDNFVEKSRDDVSPDLVAFFSLQIKNRFVSSLISMKAKAETSSSNTFNKAPLTPQSTNSSESAVTVRKRSLPAKYRSATASLIAFLNNSTNVHYVRCIRPNAKPASIEHSIADRSFDAEHVSIQLASAGLVDVLRLANSTGKYTRRFSYRAFASGFSTIFDLFGIKNNFNVTTEDVIEDKENAPKCKGKVIMPGASCQFEKNVRALFELLSFSSNDECFFGKTKLFLSDKLLAFFRRLQQLITRRATFCIQKAYRKHLAEKKRLRRLLEEKERQEKEKLHKKSVPHVVVDPVVAVENASNIHPVESFGELPPLPEYSSLYLPSDVLFVDGDIVSRRRHFLAKTRALFWFHVRPNPLLHGAHVVNANLNFQHASITDCLD